jgi:hypothetical protein
MNKFQVIKIKIIYASIKKSLEKSLSMDICKYLWISQNLWIIRFVDTHMNMGRYGYNIYPTEHIQISYYLPPWISIYIPN